jgi:nucleoside-diphosphate-sugar epimerase
MRVFVTGGTGYVGSHTVVALVAAGHQVRVLVRDKARIAPAFSPLGVDESSAEFVIGDVTDPDGVSAALDGCDAAVHAASVFSLDSRDHRRIAAVNVRGTDVVLNAAVGAGADPVVHVSSTGALLPAPDPVLSERTPIGSIRDAYFRSKADSERVARRLQEDGAPVVVTYPGAVMGPHDPHLGDQLSRLRNTLRGLMPMWPTGGLAVSDVRDVALLHARVLEKGRGPRRYVATAHYATTRDFVGLIRELTGRRLPAIFVPAKAMLPALAPVGAVQRVWPWHIPAEYGGVYFLAFHPPVDDSLARIELGITPRDLEETLADSIRWLYEHNLVTAKQAGRLADEGSAGRSQESHPPLGGGPQNVHAPGAPGGP